MKVRHVIRMESHFWISVSKSDFSLPNMEEIHVNNGKFLGWTPCTIFGCPLHFTARDHPQVKSRGQLLEMCALFSWPTFKHKCSGTLTFFCYVGLVLWNQGQDFLRTWWGYTLGGYLQFIRKHYNNFQIFFWFYIKKKKSKMYCLISWKSYRDGAVLHIFFLINWAF